MYKNFVASDGCGKISEELAKHINSFYKK